MGYPEAMSSHALLNSEVFSWFMSRLNPLMDYSTVKSSYGLFIDKSSRGLINE